MKNKPYRLMVLVFACLSGALMVVGCGGYFAHWLSYQQGRMVFWAGIIALVPLGIFERMALAKEGIIADDVKSLARKLKPLRPLLCYVPVWLVGALVLSNLPASSLVNRVTLGMSIMGSLVIVKSLYNVRKYDEDSGRRSRVSGPFLVVAGIMLVVVDFYLIHPYSFA